MILFALCPGYAEWGAPHSYHVTRGDIPKTRVEQPLGVGGVRVISKLSLVWGGSMGHMTCTQEPGVQGRERGRQTDRHRAQTRQAALRTARPGMQTSTVRSRISSAGPSTLGSKSQEATAPGLSPQPTPRHARWGNGKERVLGTPKFSPVKTKLLTRAPGNQEPGLVMAWPPTWAGVSGQHGPGHLS